MDKKIYMFKESLLNSGLFKRVSNVQYRLKECPICGDRKWHCYVKIDINSDEPVMFNCFKCNSSGIVGQKFIEGIGLDDISIPKFNGYTKLNTDGKVSSKIPLVNVNERDDISKVVSYIESRVGVRPTLADLQIFNYVGDPHGYVTKYLGIDDIGVIHDRYWFQMTNGNIIGRWKDDNNDIRWRKYKSSRIKHYGLYKLALPIDLYQPINVVIAEGVMDVIGLYYNYHGCENNIYIATTGKNYIKGMEYMISRGIFGTGVSVKIFKDSDVPTNKIWIDNKYRYLFKRIDIYENISAHDYGVKPDELDIHRIIERKV